MLDKLNIGDKVLTITGKEATIVNILICEDKEEYWVLTDEMEYEKYTEYELKINERYYKTLIKDRKRHSK